MHVGSAQDTLALHECSTWDCSNQVIRVDASSSGDDYVESSKLEYIFGS